MKKEFPLKTIFLILFAFLSFPVFARADSPGQESKFIIEKTYSDSGVQDLSAELVRVGKGIYFYVEKSYWDKMDNEQKRQAISSFSYLDSEFVDNIKPKLNKDFGTEGDPGIDNDPKIVVLFHTMKGSSRGYIRNVDSYSKINNPTSNEREMVYLNALHMNNAYLKEFLTHEYMHLITINQKEKRLGGKPEATWLSEGLSEYAVSLVGYNDKENSYIENRVNVFINSPSDSLTGWNNQVVDYGSVTLFMHYVAEKYGTKVLSDTLKSSKFGIDALNDSLKANGVKESIQKIFINFSVAVYLNDCSAGDKFCFKSPKLKDMHVLTMNNFLPTSGDSNMFLGQTLSPFSGQYQKFIGGNGDLKFKFKGTPSGFFSLYYIVKKMDGSLVVNSLNMPIDSQEGEVVIKGMGKDVMSVVFIPSVVNFYSVPQDTKFYYSLGATNFVSPTTQNLPITIDKPLNEMTKQELMNTLLRLLVYIMAQPRYSASNVIE